MPFGFDEFLANYGPFDPNNPWQLAALQAGTPENPVVPRTDPMMPPTLPPIDPTTPRMPERMTPMTSSFDSAPTATRVPEVTRPVVGSPDERLGTPSTADSYMAAAQKAMQNKQFNQALADIAKSFPARKPIGDFGAMPQAPQVGHASGVDPGAAGRGNATAMMAKFIQGLGENRAGIVSKGKKRPAGFGKNIDFPRGR